MLFYFSVFEHEFNVLYKLLCVQQREWQNMQNEMEAVNLILTGFRFFRDESDCS